MLLIVEIVLIVGAIYRRRFLETIGLFILLFIAQVATVELQIDTKPVNLLVELAFMAGLLILILLPKKKLKEPSCPKCDKPLQNHTFSCPHCGAALTETTQKEEQTQNSYKLVAILQDKKGFETIKSMLIAQYEPLGYNVKPIDKPQALMLKNDEVKESYIFAKLNGHDLTLEVYNVEKPKFRVTKEGYVKSVE